MVSSSFVVGMQLNRTDAGVVICSCSMPKQRKVPILECKEVVQLSATLQNVIKYRQCNIVKILLSRAC